MFEKIPEKKARYIRRTLAFGWIIIIVSLFWDPISPELTRPDNLSSPFRLNSAAILEEPGQSYQCPLYLIDAKTGKKQVDWGGHEAGTCDFRCVKVQGECLIEQPYSLSARVFWAVLVPIVPLFLMVFGHEAWRRICPLSFFSQLPRALGIQHKQKFVNQQSGMVDKKIVLLSPDSWLAKNHWLVQFGLLVLGLTARLLFINSDRLALASFFIGVILISMALGYWFGGKFWCNYICPLSPVQKIYSEPRGLLESQSHLKKLPVTQSMCRTITASGEEQSNCVGCKSPCSDIDLERAYWQTQEAPGRRLFYYGYLGMVIAFYTYYALYSGNWDYYNSGAWTHEENQLQQIWNPGIYWQGHAIGIPKLVVAPIYLLFWIFLVYGFGILCEKTYGRVRERLYPAASKDSTRHHVFSVFSFVSINVFYIFGGRPNLNLLPSLGMGFIDVLIVSCSSFWLWRTLGRTSKSYTREGLGESLRRQLKKLKLDLTQALEGRPLEELSPDETYVLAKALPGFSHTQQKQIYKEMLQEALQGGNMNSIESLSLMQDLRQQMGVSLQEHEKVLAELGVEDSSLLDPNQKKSHEDQLRISNFRQAMESLLMRWVEEGTPIKKVLDNPEASETLQKLTGTYGISREEQSEILSELFGEQGALIEDARSKVVRLHMIALQMQSLFELENRTDQYMAVFILKKNLSNNRKILCERLLNILPLLEESAEAKALAWNLSLLAHEEVGGILLKTVVSNNAELQWQNLLSPLILEILHNDDFDASCLKQTKIPLIKAEQYLNNVPSATELLQSFLRGSGAVPQAASLFLQSKLDPTKARQYAVALLNQDDLDGLPKRAHYQLPDWLVQDLAKHLLAVLPEENTPPGVGYQVVTVSIFQKLMKLYQGQFFNHLELEVLMEIAREVQLRNYPKGSKICQKDDPSDELFLINSGAAEVILPLKGDKNGSLVLTPGETIGELGVLMHKKRSATVLAMEEDNFVIALDRIRFEKFLVQNSETAISFIQILGDRLLQTTGIIQEEEKEAEVEVETEEG